MQWIQTYFHDGDGMRVKSFDGGGLSILYHDKTGRERKSEKEREREARAKVSFEILERKKKKECSRLGCDVYYVFTSLFKAMTLNYSGLQLCNKTTGNTLYSM